MAQKYRALRDFEPIYIIVESPAYNIAPYAARTALLHILTYWWTAGCPELGGANYMAMSGLRGCHWNRHGEFIMKALEDIMPELRDLHVIITKKRNGRRYIASLAKAALAEKRAKDKLLNGKLNDKIQLSDKPTHSGVISPQKSSHHNIKPYTPKPLNNKDISGGLTESNSPIVKKDVKYTTEHLPD